MVCHEPLPPPREEQTATVPFSRRAYTQQKATQTVPSVYFFYSRVLAGRTKPVGVCAWKGEEVCMNDQARLFVLQYARDRALYRHLETPVVLLLHARRDQRAHCPSFVLQAHAAAFRH